MPMRGLENHIVMAGNVLPPPPYSQHMQTAIGTRAPPSALVGTHFRVAILPSRSVPAPRPPLPLPHARGAAVMRMTIDNIERDSYLVHTTDGCTCIHLHAHAYRIQYQMGMQLLHLYPSSSTHQESYERLLTRLLVCVTIASNSSSEGKSALVYSRRSHGD